MNIYIEAEKQLATLLGWTSLFYSGCYETWWGNLHGEGEQEVPDWTQSNDEAFKLMVEYDCYPEHEDGCNAVKAGAEYVMLRHHIDKAQAVRYAIVMATIRKLEGKI